MKISMELDTWCRVFSEQLATSPDVFWIRTLDYKQQLYLSPSFSSVWEIQAETLYQFPDAFSNFIVSSNRDELSEDYCRRHQREESGVTYYKIKSSFGEGRYIRDRFMTLCDRSNKPIVAFGIARDITQTFNIPPHDHDHIIDINIQMLKDKLGLIIDNPQKKTIALTMREKQCGYHLIQGKTAEETANLLHLSRRTVEKHLESLKAKFNITRKIDLVKTLTEMNFTLDE